jgi:hypothetical protein
LKVWSCLKGIWFISSFWQVLMCWIFIQQISIIFLVNSTSILFTSDGIGCPTHSWASHCISCPDGIWWRHLMLDDGIIHTHWKIARVLNAVNCPGCSFDPVRPKGVVQIRYNDWPMLSQGLSPDDVIWGTSSSLWYYRSKQCGTNEFLFVIFRIRQTDLYPSQLMFRLSVLKRMDMIATQWSWSA